MALLLPLRVIIIADAILRYYFLEIRTLASNMIFENSPEILVLLNRDNEIVDFNRAASQFYREPGISLKSGPSSTLFRKKPSLREDLLACEKRTIEYKKFGNLNFYEITSLPIHRDGKGNYGRLKIIRNITENQKFQEHLKQQASTDELGGLYNRREFFLMGKELLKKTDETESHLSLMIDVDHFKRIKDSFGHNTGDIVIRGLGEIFHEKFRKNDITGRIGGKEFAVLMEALPQGSCTYTGRELQKNSRESQLSGRRRNHIRNNQYWTVL